LKRLVKTRIDEAKRTTAFIASGRLKERLGKGLKRFAMRLSARSRAIELDRSAQRQLS
jgi:hypothetical protein